MMTGKWTSLTALFIAAALATGCSAIPEKLKFAKKDDVSSKHLKQLNKPVPFLLSYASWQEEKGDLSEASESYQLVLAKEPTNLQARLGLARVSMKSGELDRAEMLFKDILKVAPGNHEVLDSLGQFYAEKKDWSRSVALLDQAVRLAPENRIYRYHYAAALAHFGKAPESLHEFRKILSEDEAHYNLAYILKKQGDWRGAEHHVQQSLALNPKFPEALQLFEELKYAGGEHTRYARHSAPAATQQAIPAGYNNSAGYPAGAQQPQFPGKVEYSEEHISPLDY